jgi:hypothetical protein
MNKFIFFVFFIMTITASCFAQNGPPPPPSSGPAPRPMVRSSLPSHSGTALPTAINNHSDVYPHQSAPVNYPRGGEYMTGKIPSALVEKGLKLVDVHYTYDDFKKELLAFSKFVSSGPGISSGLYKPMGDCSPCSWIIKQQEEGGQIFVMFKFKNPFAYSLRVDLLRNALRKMPGMIITYGSYIDDVPLEW